MTVEEERIETTDWGQLFAEIEEVQRSLFCIRTLDREGKWGIVVVEGGFSIAKQTPEIHCC